MWQLRHPRELLTGQVDRASLVAIWLSGLADDTGPWHERQRASYWAEVIDRALRCGSWQVVQPKVPPLSMLHRLWLQPKP